MKLIKSKGHQHHPDKVIAACPKEIMRLPRKRTERQLIRRSYGLVFTCLLALALIFLTISVMASSGDHWTTFSIELASEPRGRPAIYENRVAWVEFISPSRYQSQEEKSDFKSNLWVLPEIDPARSFINWSLWSESKVELPVFYKVMVYDLVTGQIWDLIDRLPPCRYDLIDMFGDWVITQQGCSQELEAIHGFNLQTNEYLPITPYEGDLISHQLPSIDENYVLWVDVEGCCSSDIRMFDLDTRTTISVTNDGGGGNLYEYFPDKSGDWVVWASGGSFDIYAYNLVTTEKITITNDPATQSYPRIDGNIVVWTDQRNNDGDDYGDIYGYDLETRQEFAVAGGAGSQYSSSIQGSLVSWTEYKDETLSIRALDMDTGEYFDIYSHPPGTSLLEPSVAYGDRVAWHFYIYSEGMSYLYTAKRLRFQSYLPIVVR